MSEIWNLSTLCRCCHADGCFKTLSLPYKGENNVEIYGTMLQETFGITMASPMVDASYMICEQCILQLRDSARFKEQVMNCEQKFKIYCANEQFLSTQGSIKVEVKIENHSNNNDTPDDEFTSEVDIKPINELKSEGKKTVKNAKDSKENIKKKKRKPVKGEETLKNAKDSKENIIKKKKRTTMKGTTVQKSLVVHVETEKGDQYSCKSCGGCYQTKKEIQSHIYKQHSTPFKCEHCFKYLQTPAGYKHHLKSHAEKNLTCPHCPKLFTRQKYFEEHVNRHTKLFKCDLCQKDFKYKNTLRRHLVWHAGANKVKLCELCGKSFNDQTNLDIHVRTVHEKQRPYPCSLCEKSYTAKKHLKYHLESHIGGKKRFQCDVCERKFRCPKTLKVHKFEHDNKFLCRFCTLVFDDRNSCASHVRSVHQDHPCSLCGKNFTSTFSLLRHIEFHKGIKRFSCEICGLKFTQKCLVLRHKSRKHNPERIVKEKTKCNICKRSFVNMESHMKSHTERNFACDICGKTYPENNSLNRHKLQKHLGRSFDCEFCDKKYMQKAKLATHKLKMHKLKVEPSSVEGF